MRLSDWCKQEGRGALTRLQFRTGIAYSTLIYVKQGQPLRDYRKARAIEEATGGQVSVEELCEPTDKSAAAGTGG